MQTWSLKRYVQLYGVERTAEVWGVRHQAVSAAIKSNRTITITYSNDYFSVTEEKTLKLPAMSGPIDEPWDSNKHGTGPLTGDY